LRLQGVWVHDPLDPQGTVRQFPFGKASRSTGNEITLGLTNFADREDPSPTGVNTVPAHTGCRRQIPFGATFQADLATLGVFSEARRTLVFRDNRGRGAHGTVSGYTENDQTWGTEVGLIFTRVDMAEITAQVGQG
jgi:hypothetical protein